MLAKNGFNATKIVCTLGPASAQEGVIEELVKAGMAVARLNFSHGTHQFHGALITRIRRVSRRLNQPVAILQDLCGPKVRVGRLACREIAAAVGSKITLTSRDVAGDEDVIPVTPPELLPDLKTGDRVLIDDGAIQLEVVSSARRAVTARVVKGGTIREGKGINLPSATLSLPSLTSKDLADLRFGVEHGVDMVALSFVRSAADVERLKRELQKLSSDIPVIAKLEKPQAIKHLAAIMNAADGVMVARGDLGVEMPLEEVPILQKNIITIAKEYFRPVITATQMLESMTHNATPTRAEVSDVANAIFDGTDCVMLSGETSVGGYPVETVRMMSRIIHATEMKASTRRPVFDFLGRVAVDFAGAIAEAAVAMARDIDARVIACFTQSGLTARLISKQKASIPIVAFTPHKKVLNRLMLLRGVAPLYLPMIRSVDQVIAQVERVFREEGIAQAGDNVVIVSSAPISAGGETNMLKLHRMS